MRTKNKVNPHMTPSPGVKPGSHWWEASALTTAPSVLPQRHKDLTITQKKLVSSDVVILFVILLLLIWLLNEITCKMPRYMVNDPALGLENVVENI